MTIIAYFCTISGLDIPTDSSMEAYPGLAGVEKALATLCLDPVGRGQAHDLAQGIVLVDESYNANPASMAAALQTLALHPRARHLRRIVVLGDMRELGDHSDQLHRDLAPAVRDAGIDLVFAAGPHMRQLYDALPKELCAKWSETSTGLSDDLLAAIRPGDVVMVKGSLGSRMGPLVDALKSHFGPAR